LQQLLLFALVIGLPYVGLIYTLLFYKRRLELAQMQLVNLARSRAQKSDSTQRAVIRGQLAEKVAPLLPGFPFEVGDYHQMGQPVDFVAFVGLSAARDGLDGIKEIVIGDVKSGSARLNPTQESIKRAVDAGRVRWQTIHIDQEFTVTKRKR
jgi:predicted Holliday junction resolvase-like endonuclease